MLAGALWPSREWAVNFNNPEYEKGVAPLNSRIPNTITCTLAFVCVELNSGACGAEVGENAMGAETPEWINFVLMIFALQ